MSTADDVVDALLRPVCPFRLLPFAFPRVRRGARLSNRRPRSAKGPGQTAPLPRRGEDYGTPGAAPQQSREGDRSADAKKGALPRRAWLYRVVAGFRNVLTGIWLWTCLKSCGRSPSGGLDSSRFLEATNAAATGLSLLSSMPMVPGTVTVMVPSPPGVRRTRAVPIWLLRLRRRGTRPPRPSREVQPRRTPSLTSVTDVGRLPAAVHCGDAEPARRRLSENHCVCHGDVGEKTAPT